MHPKLRIEYWLSKANHQWYFHLKGRNGRIVAPSEGYKRLRSLQKTLGLFSAYGIPDKFIPEQKSNDPSSVYFRA
jgi:uncharacterized protein YegP (UPF0339 family)